MKDFFGTNRGCCKQKGCDCVDFSSKLENMTEEEVEELGGRYMSCQRRSEVTLTCVCGHDSAKHEALPEPSSD
ncbi:hypothetical protein CYMTET_27584 [Cymbomonas tetramitiformis]|uniref:Uncharacterized protein n=1 Tax=Cymbomonas tetramitiformis TaxID=36881 RepID=A0AAE0FQ38_9CHLO|nr:hypothetical protein CYMTET_27584 [Cymbomonas tetramitiformis]